MFDAFPETGHCGLRRNFIVPLYVKNDLLGFLNLGRIDDEPFQDDELHEAFVASRLLKVVFERDELEKNLESRKLIERAKGILRRMRVSTRNRHTCRFENISRDNQCSMATVARGIIDADVRQSREPRRNGEPVNGPPGHSR